MTIPSQRLVHILPLPGGSVEAGGFHPRSLLQYGILAERIGALVDERRTSEVVARHAIALAFVLSNRLPRHLEFRRRPITELAFDPLGADVLDILGLKIEATRSAVDALRATGVLWSDETDRMTFGGESLSQLAPQDTDREIFTHLLDIAEISPRLDTVIPMTTRGSRERKAGVWFVLAALAADAVDREWIPLAANAFINPLAFESGSVTKAIKSCVDAGILQRNQRPGQTAQYRFITAIETVSLEQRRSPLQSVIANPETIPAYVLEINGAKINLAPGVELTIESGMHCRVSRDPVTGATRMIIEQAERPTQA